MLRSRLSSSQGSGSTKSETKKTPLRQQSIASFFSKKSTSSSTAPKRTATTSHTVISASQPIRSVSQNRSLSTTGRKLATHISKKPRLSTQEVINLEDEKESRPPIHRAKLNRSKINPSSSSSLFSSQGSFDECDPVAELQRLKTVEHLNSYKPTLSRAPSFKRSSSKTEVVEIESDTNGVTAFHEVTNISSGSRQLSFTSTQLDFHREESDTFIPLQFSPRKTARMLAFQSDLKLASSKKLKHLNDRGGSTSSSSSSKKRNIVPLKLTKEQETVIDLVVNKKANIFYTGSAGTGKSVILNNIVAKLGAVYGRDAIAVTASTGLAASTVGGVTLHKWAGVGIAQAPAQVLVNRVMKRRDILNVYKNTKVLIIDEVSMIDGMFLSKIEYIARSVRKSDRPFGGIQVVLTGDFFQLPPVQKRDNTNANNQQSIFCFESEMWQRCIHKTILLTKVFRQQDDELVKILNCIRFGDIEQNMALTLQNLSRHIEYDDGIFPTELYSTRREVEMSNSRQLGSLPGTEHRYEAQDIATPEQRNLLDSSVMAERVLVLKENAQVMMLKNKPEVDLVNGSLGKVLFFTTTKLMLKMNQMYRVIDDDTIIDMRLVSEVIGNPVKRNSDNFIREVQARPMSRANNLGELLNIAIHERDPHSIYPYVRWSIGKKKFYHELVIPDKFPVDLPGDKTGIERTQLPIMLCWALSIHKAQGQTIQRLKVDLKNIFEAGQVYVALSRAVSMDNLQVLNFNAKKIRSNDKVKQFYTTLETIK
ncbi:similar to Saccharomyces cerevisiae YHR031C RRM3 DNA helicase involved in rDNA replication and Ty1 transposition [Maudiozyma saulgeensis]|uniref:ATP-dependent DNA helicase RRM3 n=1 Tax=Maudiozyma saulgeensis TaxID=1789683 RepID=A0A1X7R554_9SACH|nr:similar to Saccharomyces cerevisiae YHR031C RRM3 DNA helicase involved in rDNA replication and Ty1 transposition [Kazachstania saulgeensis]